VTATTASGSACREPALLGQTVVVIGGSSGIGLETARQARSEGAEVVLTGRNPERLERAAQEVGAQSSAAFDANDPDAIKRFFEGVGDRIDHVMVTAGSPTYGALLETDTAKLRSVLTDRIVLVLDVARNAAPKMKPGGTLLLMGTTGRELGIAAPAFGGLPAFTAALALELAPVRINLIAAGFIDSPLSASILGDSLEARRQQLRETLPIRRVVEPTDVAALAVHIMINTALTGATYDIDGGQQFVEG
jgi:NAD(P)-dependent dehydrogenase (short-subunit alcohol dehydrogenase family)